MTKNTEVTKLPHEWDDDEVIAACVNYSTRSQIRLQNESAYVCIAYRNLWPKLTWIRNRSSRRSNRITDEEVLETSKAFANEGRGAFQHAHPDLYSAAYRRGLLDKMPWLDDPQGRTTHAILESSKAYATTKEFKLKDPAGYATLRKRGALDAATWLDDGKSPDWLKEQREERAQEAAETAVPESPEHEPEPESVPESATA